LKGYKNKLKEFISLEKEIDQANASLKSKGSEYNEQFVAYKFLKENNYTIDSKLEVDFNNKKIDMNNLISLLEVKSKLFNNLCDELNPGNFRNVVYCLCKEEGTTLEQLAENLNCSSETFVKLVRHGEINKGNYKKLCNYFELDPSYHLFIRYCEEYKSELKSTCVCL